MFELFVKLKCTCIFLLFMFNRIMVKVLDVTGSATEFNTTEKCQYCIIFFHGVESLSKSWDIILAALHLPNTRFVVIKAKLIPYPLMPESPDYVWADMQISGKLRVDDEEGIERVISYAHGVIDDQIKQGISSNNIIISGYFQGGALALLAGLKYPKKLGGLMVFSAWISLFDKIDVSCVTHNRDIPMLVPYHWEYVLNAKQKIFSISNNVTYKEVYPDSPFNVDPSELEEITNFTKRAFGPTYENLFNS